MKNAFSPAEFMQRAREAKHDSLGLNCDLESTVVLANMARRRFSGNGTPEALLQWEQLVEEVAEQHEVATVQHLDDSLLRWLAVESIRLEAAHMQLGSAHNTRSQALSGWVPLPSAERHEIVRAFRMETVQSVRSTSVRTTKA